MIIVTRHQLLLLARRLVLSGGQQLLHVRFCCRQKKFLLVLGGMMEGAGMNPQHLVEPQLEQHLNEHKNLALTAKILHETYAPMR